MAAAAFTETLIFKGSNGRQLMVPATVSDVAAEYAVFPDGGTTLQIPSDADYVLVDMIVVTGGTDTSKQNVYVNQQATSLQIFNKANLTTTVGRQFQNGQGVTFARGSQVRLIQAA